MLIESPLERSLTSLIPSISLFFLILSIENTKSFLLMPYGISLTTISLWSLNSLISYLLVIWNFPLPVSYISLMPSTPEMIPPVGKSGPWTIFIKSSISHSGLLIL